MCVFTVGNSTLVASCVTLKQLGTSPNLSFISHLCYAGYKGVYFCSTLHAFEIQTKGATFTHTLGLKIEEVEYVWLTMERILKIIISAHTRLTKKVITESNEESSFSTLG